MRPSGGSVCSGESRGCVNCPAGKTSGADMHGCHRKKLQGVRVSQSPSHQEQHEGFMSGKT